jgi:hypothetical protein
MRQITLRETEENSNTPNCFNLYLKNNKYHHSVKGCKIEMMIGRSKNFNNNNATIMKWCKTHKKYCSKSGWELGWYQGTYSPLLEGSEKEYTPKFVGCSCGRKHLKGKKCPICNYDILPIDKANFLKI